jgi:hypothetical protein
MAKELGRHCRAEFTTFRSMRGGSCVRALTALTALLVGCGGGEGEKDGALVPGVEVGVPSLAPSALGSVPASPSAPPLSPGVGAPAVPGAPPTPPAEPAAAAPVGGQPAAPVPGAGATDPAASPGVAPAAPLETPAATPVEPAPAPAVPAPEASDPSNLETPVNPAPEEEESHDSDHCISGYDPEPTDADMGESFAEFSENGQVDATVQPAVIEWMERNAWQEAHFQWHQVRRCGGVGFGGGGGGGGIDPCQYPEMLPQANECENARDGYEFLVMHRHMMQSLRQLWPNHTEQFEGWEKFPEEQDYPEVLRQYYSDWSGSVRQDAAIADNIEQNLDMFADEGEFGMWLQCGSLGGGVGMGSLHGSLHFNGYPPNNQSHSVTNQRRNLDSYVFWKLHGWIDNVWEKYRIAKGLTPDEPKLKDELIAQCREMDALAELIDPSLVQSQEPEDLPEEAGFFHDVVRPGLEDFGCATCHGEGEEAGLRLGYQVSSGEVVERLVNVDSAHAAGYKLVVPGDPDNSWLYLKAAGLSVSSGVQCQGVMNCAQAMPPGMGESLSQMDLDNLRQWIVDGAPAPTQL